MVTVTDPSGTPVVTYNKTGVTIRTVAANGTTQGAGTALTPFGGWDVFLVTTADASDQAVVLPPSADVGYVAEVYCVSASSEGYTNPIASVFPSSGHQIGLAGANSPLNVAGGTNYQGGTLFRLVSAGQWQVIRGD